MSIAAQVAILAVVQSLTEFLPISSSAHLILLPWFLGWGHLGLIFDVSLHVGTLIAILIYFRLDWWALLQDLPNVFRDGFSRSLLGVLIVGTLPVAIFGLTALDFIEQRLRGPETIAICLAGFGLLLYVAERKPNRERTVQQVTLLDGLVIGLFQMLALAPGVSRSGITITGGLFRGFRTAEAARLSFLMSTPAIAAAGFLEAGHAYHEYLLGSQSLDPLMRQEHPLQLILLGILLSAVTGLLCIRYFLQYLQRRSLVPFVVYRVLLAAGILAALWRAGR